MSLSILKLMDLSGKADERKEKLGKNPDIPERYNTIQHAKGVKMDMDKNFNYDPVVFDQFSEIMRADKFNRYNVNGLYLDVKQKKGTNEKDLPYQYTLEGWIDPAQRRRYIDSQHAPPFDFVNGAERQEFTVGANEDNSKDNVSLVKQAHQNYNKWINRYNIPTVPISIVKP